MKNTIITMLKSEVYMEYLDLYDKDKNLTGEKILRGNAKQDIPEGKFINIAIIFIETLC